ncbi:MAG: hypothetical protein ABTQ32_18340 [Myxococcaceae bacterium]
MMSLALTLALTAAPAVDHDDWSPNATRRHAGALIGAVLGAGLPLLALPLLDARCVPTFACLTDMHPVLFTTSAMLVSVGLTLGHGLGDGSAPSFGAAAIGAVVGSLVNLGWLAMMGSTTNVESREAAALLMVATVPITIALQLLSLEFRHEALSQRPAAAVPWKRFGAAVGATALTAAAGVLSGLLMGLLFLPSNLNVFIPVGLALSVPLAPLSAVAAHRAFGGRGGFGAAYLGMLAAGVVGVVIALVATGANATVPFTNQNFFAAMQSTTAGFGVAGIAIAALAGSAIALELSHASQEDEQPLQKPVEVQLSFAPMPNGGAAVLAGRW